MLRYAITDRKGFAGDEAAREEAVLRQASGWAADGVDYVQLREKDLEAAALEVLARRMLAAVREGPRGTKLLINSRADVAVAVGADGVHLTSAPSALTPAEVRRVYALAGLPEPALSVSCHTPDEVVRAREAGVSLILFGPVFEKRVGADVVREGGGPDLLRAACVAAGSTPVLGLGGMTEENAVACVDAGAAGVAGIRLFRGESTGLLSLDRS
jgi:thiamine-phosphate pyrophosphorylase